jgi:hypothetical protein
MSGTTKRVSVLGTFVVPYMKELAECPIFVVLFSPVALHLAFRYR